MTITAKQCVDFTKHTWLIRNVVSEIRHRKHIRISIREIKSGRVRIGINDKRHPSLLWIADYSDTDDVWICYGYYDKIGYEKTIGWCTYGSNPESESSIENCIRFAIERCVLSASERKKELA